MPTNPNIKVIQTVAVDSGGASTIQFSAIPQTYTDLKIVLSGRTTNGSLADSVYFSFNSSTANFGAAKIGYGDGSAASAFTQTRYAGSQPGSTATASTFSNIEIYIPNYAGSNVKSYSVDAVTENNATTAYIYFASGIWSDTAAITSITLTPNAGTFVQFTTATLYGVTSAGYGAKATGGVIYQDADYFYHAFFSSGTFTPTQSLTADCLVVAGGAGGGGDVGGGGGAGGLLGFTSQSLTATNYTVTVGGGGSGGANDTTAGSNGSNSQFGALTVAVGGGGGGAGQANRTGKNGGSGGGGARSGSAGGTGTSGQGTNGGTQSNVSLAGAGGGGATVAGSVNGDSIGGNGGNGSSTYSSWGIATGTGQNVSGTYWYAGGGGGGSYPSATLANGGNGGGAKGGGGDNGGSGDPGRTPVTVAANAQANTGGGGGGGRGDISQGSIAGGAGGSGIVIVRYAK